MALSTSQAMFGVHSVTAYNPTSLLPYGTAKVVGSASFGFSSDLVELRGGSNLYPWKVEPGPITSEGSITLREYPDWLHEVFLGNAATTRAAESGGGVSSLANAEGTSVVAATGLASVGVKSGSEADVKTGFYVVKAESATTVNVYAMSDVDFATGTDIDFENDALKITASPLTITTSTAVTIPNTGLELTGGSGTIGMVEGDTAFFDARAINAGSTEVKIGGNNSTYVDVGLVLTAQKQGDGSIHYIDVFRAKGIGVPMNMTESAFAESEIAMRAFYDTKRDGVFRFLRVDNT